MSTLTEVPKFSLIDCTKEELDSFGKDFQALIDKHSLYFEPVAQKERMEFTDSQGTKKSAWADVCNILVKKKVPIPEKA